MKKIIITGAVKITPNGMFRDGLINVKSLTIKGLDTMEVSDGSHTMNELYDHRITLFIALCSMRHYADLLQDMHEGDEEQFYHNVWRSELHHDGTGYEGWFILGVFKEAGKQITYHLPMSRWEETDFAETLDRAPEWDGHTPADVLERLKNL